MSKQRNGDQIVPLLAAAAGGDGVDRENSNYSIYKCEKNGGFEKDSARDSASRIGLVSIFLSAAAAAALPDNNNNNSNKSNNNSNNNNNNNKNNNSNNNNNNGTRVWCASTQLQQQQ